MDDFGDQLNFDDDGPLGSFEGELGGGVNLGGEGAVDDPFGPDASADGVFGNGVAPGATSSSSKARQSLRMLSADMITGDVPVVDVKAVFPYSDGMAVPRVVNTICLLNLGTQIDLRELASGARNVELLPKRRLVVLRITEPACAVLVRAGGICTISGAASVPAARRAATIAAKTVRRVLNLTALTKVAFRVMSLNVRFDLKHPIRLESLKLAHPGSCSYESESFCGAILRLGGVTSDNVSWSAVATVFVSGKVTMTGLSSHRQVALAYHALLALVAPHAKGADLSKLLGSATTSSGVMPSTLQA